jgi:hypothetical protein
MAGRDPLQEFRKLHRQRHAFPDLARAPGIDLVAAHRVELFEQELEVPGDKLVPKCGIKSRAGEFGVRD